jgi:hypothetical protein
MTVVVGGWSGYGAPHPTRVKGDQCRQIVRPIEISAQIISWKFRRDFKQNCVRYDGTGTYSLRDIFLNPVATVLKSLSYR